MTASPANRANTGNENLSHRSLNTDPEKSAIAPIGVRFQGCGRIRSAAASRTRTAAIPVFIHNNCFSFISVFMPKLPPPQVSRKTQTNPAPQLLPSYTLQGSGISVRHTQTCEILHFLRRDRRPPANRGKTFRPIPVRQNSDPRFEDPHKPYAP